MEKMAPRVNPEHRVLPAFLVFVDKREILGTLIMF